MGKQMWKNFEQLNTADIEDLTNELKIDPSVEKEIKKSL